MQGFLVGFFSWKVAVPIEPRPVTGQQQLLSKVLLVHQNFAILIAQRDDRGSSIVADLELLSTTVEFDLLKKF